MTVKQEFYLLTRKKEQTNQSWTISEIKEFCSTHRSVQWRTVSKKHVQIRFSEGSWIDPQCFADNYRNHVIKELADKVSSASVILTKDEMLEAISFIRVSDGSEEIDQLRKQSDKLSQLVKQLESEVKHYKNSAQYNQNQLNQMKSAYQDLIDDIRAAKTVAGYSTKKVSAALEERRYYE